MTLESIAAYLPGASHIRPIVPSAVAVPPSRVQLMQRYAIRAQSLLETNLCHMDVGVEEPKLYCDNFHIG